MTGPLPVFLIPGASRAIGKARAWWLANRDKAPLAFDEELDKALDLVSRQPSVGARATNVKLRGVRRLRLGRVHYFLYYRVASEPEHVEVLGIWHTSRGSGPSF